MLSCGMIGKASTARALLRAATKKSQTFVNPRRCASQNYQHVWVVKPPPDKELDGTEPDYYYGLPDLRRWYTYLPVQLGDKFQDERYTVLHKLGWGRCSTVWAAKDNREQRYVALKISGIAKEGGSMARRAYREKSFMSIRESDENPANSHLATGLDRLAVVHDHFRLAGYHGNHDCFVVELQGQTVSEFIEQRKAEDAMLSKRLLKRITKDTLLGLRALHAKGIAHGDIRTHNVAFTLPPMDHLTEEEFCQKLGEKVVKEKLPLNCFPEYLVQPCKFSKELSSQWSNVKIFDFGESFDASMRPKSLTSPRVCQAPEAVSCPDDVSHRVDMWSMGCMLFELATGQPLLDSHTTQPAPHMRRILDLLSDQEIPNRWREKSNGTIDLEPPQEPSGRTLQTRLEEICFADGKKGDLTRSDIAKVAELAGKMLRLDPAERASAAEILEDPWLADDVE
ncbi:kinase-like domain-containing protein [Phyllosticta citribraziliensis]|uniref:non-specific serine/threonine protein kinase n=1 Tax=Phyllosticta citribraziliensis TaxID=989973 RepID=A0ABR1MCI7_9PEZI